MQLFLSFLSHSGLSLSMCVWVYFSAARSHLCALTILVLLSCGSHSLFEQQTKTEINWWEQKEKQRQKKKNTHTRIRISNEVWPMWTSHHFKIKKKKQNALNQFTWNNKVMQRSLLNCLLSLSQLFAFSFVMTLQYIRTEHFVYWTTVVIWKN